MVDLDPVIFLQILHTGRIAPLDGVTLDRSPGHRPAQGFLPLLPGLPRKGERAHRKYTHKEQKGRCG